MLSLFGKTIPSVVKDPFDSRCIKTTSMRCDKKLFTDEFEFYGYVEFKNDETEGKQRFTAGDLGELYVKIAEFCESLE